MLNIKARHADALEEIVNSFFNFFGVRKNHEF